MKKSLLILCILFTFSSLVSASGFQYNGYPAVNVTVNGEPLTFDVPAIIIDSRTLLPLRKVAESMNSIVSWDASTKTAVVTKPHVSIMFTETSDGRTAKGAPYGEIPLWTQHESFLSYIGIGNLAEGEYTLEAGLYKFNESTQLDDVIELKKDNKIQVLKPHKPVTFASVWDVSKVRAQAPGMVKFIVRLKDNHGKYQKVAEYKINI